MRLVSGCGVSCNSHSPHKTSLQVQLGAVTGRRFALEVVKDSYGGWPAGVTLPGGARVGSLGMTPVQRVEV